MASRSAVSTCRLWCRPIAMFHPCYRIRAWGQQLVFDQRWRPGCRGCNSTPKSFDLSKIRVKSLKICAKSMKMFARYLKFWANYLKIRIKIAPNVVWFLKIGAQRGENHMRPFFPFFWEVTPKLICVGGNTQRVARASLGKFEQKSFAPPKICLLLPMSSTITTTNYPTDSTLLIETSQHRLCG